MKSQHVLALITTFSTIASAVPTPASTGGHREDQPQGANSGDVRSHGSVQASTRLMKELMETYKSDGYKKGVFSVELVDDNLYEWQVKLFFPNPEHGLHKDLKRLRKQGKQDYVLLRISFPEHYPSELPFVRIVYPIMRERQSGALCMHALSPQGWVPECTMETLILTIIDHMIAYKQRVELIQDRDEYSDEKSEQDRWTYAKVHGWDMPEPKGETQNVAPDTG